MWVCARLIPALPRPRPCSHIALPTAIDSFQPPGSVWELLSADDAAGIVAWLRTSSPAGPGGDAPPAPRDPNMSVCVKEGGLTQEPLLVLACRHDAARIADALITAGADPNLPGLNGFTVRALPTASACPLC